MQNPRTSPSGRKVTRGERREKTPLIVATTFCLQHPGVAHATHSDQNTNNECDIIAIDIWHSTHEYVGTSDHVAHSQTQGTRTPIG